MNTTQDQSIRDTQYPDEEYLLMEDDPFASNPPRPASSAIRLNRPSPVIRRSSRDVSTETQRPSPSYVPPRRTQKQDLGQPPAPPTAGARPARNTTTTYNVPASKGGRRNIHWLFYVGLGMIAALALWALGATALNWGMNEYNNIVYGYPRTFQIDAVVGHNDSPHNPSHFIAVNLHGQIIIIELRGGDPAKSTDYTIRGLLAQGSDLLPVTLSFSDVNHDGKVDMIVHISGQDMTFYNDGTQFVLPNGNQTPTPTSTPTH